MVVDFTGKRTASGGSLVPWWFVSAPVLLSKEVLFLDIAVVGIGMLSDWYPHIRFRGFEVPTTAVEFLSSTALVLKRWFENPLSMSLPVWLYTADWPSLLSPIWSRFD